MATTLEVATDEMLSAVRTAWIAGAGAASGASPIPELLYEVRDGDSEPASAGAPWGRVTVRHATAEQYTLANDEGARLFENTGFLVVQVFAPRPSKDGATIAARLGTLVRNALQGKRTANVWFKNVSLQEQAREGPWYQLNVAAEFSWCEKT